MDIPTFQAGDYVVFGFMLAISLAIGIFYAVRDRNKKNVQNYLLGGRNMQFWSVGISLAYSFVSAVTILGVPAEFYVFGPMYLWAVLLVFIVIPVVTEIYIPVFFKVDITSSYEYLQLRFSYVARIVGTAAYIAQTILYLGVMIYAPSLAFSQVSGFNLWAAIFTTGIVCTLYTTVGGMKAVVWTDVFQGTVVILVLLITMFMSANEAGGWNEVWVANRKSGRMDFFDFDLDPRVRHSFWSLVFGLSFLWMSIFATGQSQVQRYLACGTPKKAKLSIVLALSSAVVSVVLCMIIGWVMYAYFENCDPIFSRQVNAADQLLPLMVMRVFQSAPGLAGVFMAGVYAGALSTVSTGINAMACVTIEDFIRPFVNWKQGTLTILTKVLVFFYGLTSIGFACLSSVLGNVLQTSLSVLGMLGGPTLGLFTLGIVFPFANTVGSLIGFFSGLAMTIWIYVGSTQYRAPVQYIRPKPRFVSECPAMTIHEMNTTTAAMSSNTTTISSIFTTDVTTLAPAPPVIQEIPPIADLYYVSYAYITPIGLGTTLIIGIIASLLTCGYRRRKEVDPRLITPLLDHPLIKNLFTKNFRRKMWCGVDHDACRDKSYEMKGKENEAMERDADVDFSRPHSLPGKAEKDLKASYDEI